MATKTPPEPKLSPEQEQKADSSDTTVAIPDFYPPYEEPFEMLFGCHFDNSIIKQRAYSSDDCPEYHQNHAMRTEFGQRTRALGARVSIDYVRGLTGAAKFSGKSASPPFFQVVMYEPFDFKIIRDIAMEVAKKHYPNEDDPIIRFYAGVYDVDY